MTTLLIDAGPELELAFGGRDAGPVTRTPDFRLPPGSVPPEVETIVINAGPDVRSATDLCTRLRQSNPGWTVVLWGGRDQAEAFRRHALGSIGAADAYVSRDDGERAVQAALGARTARPGAFDWLAAAGLFACLSAGLILAVAGRDQDGFLWVSASGVLYGLLMLSRRRPVGWYGRRLRTIFWIAFPGVALIAFAARLLH